MGDAVNFPISLDTDLGRQLVVDCARFREGLLDEKAIRKKYRFTNDDWESLGNDEMVRAVEEESARRVRDGSVKKEKAQKLVIRGADVLGSIMDDPNASPRHRVDAIKTLDSFTGGPEQSAPAADRFVISIVLSADGIPHTEHYNKSIKPDADDIDPFNIDTGVVAAIAAKKSSDGGSGNAI